MKKYILIAAIVLTALNTQAQKFDKDLLYGKWVAVGMKMNEFVIDKYDTEATAATFYAMARQEAEDGTLSVEDSLLFSDTATLNAKINGLLQDLSTCTMEFKKNGTMAMSRGFGQQGDDIVGKYEWLGDDKLRTPGNKKKNEYFIVTTLTKDKFAFTNNQKTEDGGTITMILERE